MTDAAPPPKITIFFAFASVYLIWGSTYLGIRIAIETLPPFYMAGIRFLISGAILYLWSRLQGAGRPTLIQWRSTLIVGACLLLGGNGSVTWAEQTVPSGVASVFIATVPFWMVLLDWMWKGALRPNTSLIFALVLGFTGVVILMGPFQILGESDLDPIGTLALLFAAFIWSVGSIYSREAPLPSSPLLTTGMEMLAGGALLILAGWVTGETGRVNLSTVSLRSILAFGYLIVFGSFLGFTAYIWLLKVTTPAKASTYAFVNPVVAVFLGWSFGGEIITVRTLLATGVIIASVVLIIGYQAKRTKNQLSPLKSENL